MMIKSVLSLVRGRQSYLHQSLSSQCVDNILTRPSLSPSPSLSQCLHTSSPVTSRPEDLNALMIEDNTTVEAVLSTETCLNSLHVLATLVLFALTATMNVILLGCLLRKVIQLRAKEDQLRGSFDALQRLYSAGRLMEDVNLE